ncbi:hypothetical protein GCM10011371_09200 [Novosphingobium marinum]|nr:hypothetical protein GCM10011371_09200 [Novosphingobium marinum]
MTATAAPASAQRSALARPMPFPPPVTMITLPASKSLLVLIPLSPTHRFPAPPIAMRAFAGIGVLRSSTW